MLKKLYDLKITDEVISDLKLGCITNCLATPVFKNGALINVARYNINKIPDRVKVEYNKNANTGDIIPFDIWKNDFRDTIICEGEKDMLIARSQGFNAITLTGGAQVTIQKDYLNYFKNRKVFICYDNDTAGKQGDTEFYFASVDLSFRCGGMQCADSGVSGAGFFYCRLSLYDNRRFLLCLRMDEAGRDTDGADSA